MPRPIPPSLLALGRRQLPVTIELDGAPFSLSRVFKNDFFAATALYEGAGRKVVLKAGRQATFLGLPFRWVGRRLARREAAALERLADLEGIPRLLGRWEDTGIVREFIEGHPLRKGEPVPDDFHDRLRRLVAQIHERDMAYVDLEKCENVLVDVHGRPCLFDFQIAWYVSPPWGRYWPVRRLGRFFQSGDLYHLVKLQRRTRPDQLSESELRVSYRRPWFVRAHRVVTWPFTSVRRAVLNRLDPRRGSGERGRVDEDYLGAT